MTDIEVTITQPVIEVKFESTLNTRGGGAVNWGDIEGTLSNQTDLQAALNGKLSTGTTTTSIAEGTNQYFTEARAIAALATTLLSYVTTTALNNALSAYVTAVSLASTLTNYVTNSSLATTLSSYATQAFVTSQGYITNVITALGFTPENVANKSTTTTLGTSNTLYPTQNAVKTYVDGLSYLKEKTLDFFVGTSTTTNTAETILRTIPITANDVANLDALWITNQLSTSQTSGNITARIRVGTDAVPADITLQTEVFASGVTATAAGANVPTHNVITFNGGNIVAPIPNATLTRAAGVQVTAITAPPLNATWYIYITSQKAVVGGTVTLFSSIIKRDRA